MKIAAIAPARIPSTHANSIQVLKMMDAFIAAGHDARLAIPSSSSKAAADLPDWDGFAEFYGLRTRFPIRWVTAKPGLRKYDYAWSSVRWARSWGADIVYTRLPQGAALSSMLGSATFLEMHDFPQGKMGPFLLKAFLKGKGACRLVVISQALATDLAKAFSGIQISAKLIVAPDGVDLSRFVDLPTPEEARERLRDRLGSFAATVGGTFICERFTAGYTGHLYRGRGINSIVELADRIPEMNFLVVGGEAEDYWKLVETVRSRGLKNLVPTGFIPNAELPVFQAACEVLLMPYQRRVAASSGGDISAYLSPMKLFEYLACGRVICSSDLPVLREVLNEHNAILLPPEDLSAWVEALRRVQRDPSLRASLARAAGQTAAAYTWEERVRRVLNSPAKVDCAHKGNVTRR
jgi:glycosyltransferase involved in cell wall biosynthesis